MKHDELRSIAHNIADSLSSGAGILIGVYDLNIYGEAAQSPKGYLIVDFLTAEALEGRASKKLAKAISRYRDALPGLCEKHGASISNFREIVVQYTPGILADNFTVTIEDSRGRRSTTEYDGLGHRAKVLDGLGRIRPKVG